MTLKFRKHFVTNSSSSSYICDFCTRSGSGYDADDVNMVYFECGHLACVDHLSGEVSKRDFPEVDHEVVNDIFRVKFTRPVSELRADELAALFDDGLPRNMCPVCNGLDGGDVNFDKLLLKFVEHRFGTDKEKLTKMLIAEFDSIEEFRAHVEREEVKNS